jgi:hypothetical protein
MSIAKNKKRSNLTLQAETLRRLTNGDLAQVVGGQPSPTSIPCTTICSSSKQ